MKNLTLKNICEAVNGTYIGDEENLNKEISGAVTDSRKIQPGFLFIPIIGARVDGHDFIPQVFEKGALACFTQKRIEANGALILVEDTEKAMKRLAAFYREQLSIPIVGVIGSVGKTSTKEMIASVLSTRFNTHKTEGNLNNEIGLPLTLFQINEKHEAAVIEMGISEFGEMDRLGEMAKPDIAVITNIGVCHLENLKTRDGILKAKTEVFAHMNEKTGVAILNGDDDKLCVREAIAFPNVIYYGKEDAKHQNEIYATDIENLGFDGMKCIIHTKENDINVTIPLPGAHNVYNATAAAAVGILLGLTSEEIKKGIESVKQTDGRVSIIKEKEYVVIDDCYNANPASICSSLEVLSHAAGRTIAVLGDMGELGEDEKELHFEVGEAVASNAIDVLFCAGTLAKEYENGARKNPKCEIHYFAKREEMIPALLDYVKEGDTILVKASHFMNFKEVVESLLK